MTTEKRSLRVMAEHILEARHEEAARDFCTLLQDGASALELEREALRVASPFLNVPAHIMVKPDGEMRGVNYDHTIMGIWRSMQLSRLMPKGYEYLPAAQAVWYLPQGLDIWSQINCEFPGHYSREQEKCPSINVRGPKQHFEEYPALTEGPFEDRLTHMYDRIVQGDKPAAFRLFLGLAEDALHDDDRRKALESQVLCAALMDFPGPRQRTGMLVNPAHKSIRARAMVDIANTLGWERSYPAFFIVIPDLANNPRNQDMAEIAFQTLRAGFGPEHRDLRHTNKAIFDRDEAEAYIELLMQGTPEDVFAHVTTLLQQGKSLVALNDVAILAASRVMMLVDTPNMNFGFFNVNHCIDYCNVAGYWLRMYDHPLQVKAPYMVAHHVNDTARFIRLRPPTEGALDLAAQAAERAAYVEKLSLKQILEELGPACAGQEAGMTTALVEAYLQRTRDRQGLINVLAFEAAKIEGDPHLPRLAMSHYEEYRHSTLPMGMRDDLLRSWSRYLSYTRRRSDRFDCVALYDEVLH